MINNCKHGVLQYTVLRPMTTVIALYVLNFVQLTIFAFSHYLISNFETLIKFFLFYIVYVRCVENIMKAISISNLHGYT